MDLLGQLLWILMFVTPALTIPLVWKFSKQRKQVRLIVGIVLAALISLVLYYLSLAIILRDGIGSIRYF